MARAGNYLKKAIADSNAAAQEAGVAAALVWIDRAEHAAKRTAELAAALVDKGLTASRATARTKSLEAILMLIEREDAESVVAALLQGCLSKQPKQMAACIGTLRECYHQFGTKAVPFKPVLKDLPKFFEHSDASVRAEAQQLAVELYAEFVEDMSVLTHASHLLSCVCNDASCSHDAFLTHPSVLPMLVGLPSGPGRMNPCFFG